MHHDSCNHLGTPIEFFSKLQASEMNPAFFATDAWTVVAWNAIESCSSEHLNAWKVLQRFADRSLKPAGIPSDGIALPIIIGFLSYDLATGKRSTVPALHFHTYEQAILWKKEGREACILGDTTFHEVVANINARPMPAQQKPSLAWTSNTTRDEYNRAFQAIQEGIGRGEFYQLNLTHQLATNSVMSPRRLFSYFLGENPAPRASYFEATDHAILSLSPERFISIIGNHIVTEPIKGTRPRGETATEDALLRADLLASTKERAELTMITDLLRNDLGAVAELGSVHVTRKREVQENPTVWHTFSTIEAAIDRKHTNVDILRSMFPGGSVTGCPKGRAMEWIDRLEKDPRGPYTGCMVFMDSCGRLESSLLIRTMVSHQRSGAPCVYAYTLGIGGGIVADSTADAEWEETWRKAAVFL